MMDKILSWNGVTYEKLRIISLVPVPCLRSSCSIRTKTERPCIKQGLF